MSLTATPAPRRHPSRPSLQGDEGELFRLHHDALRRSVRRAVHGSDALIEDACQSAWAILLRTQPRRATVRSWLISVAIHEAWRLSTADQRHGPLTGDADLDLTELEIAQHGPDRGARLDARDRLRAVARVLSPRQRELIALQAVGYSHSELAALTGDTPRTVDRQLRRAKRRLDPLRVPLGA